MGVIDLDQGGRNQQIRPTYLGPTKGWINTDEPAGIEFVMEGVGAPIPLGYRGGLLIPQWLIIAGWSIFLEAAQSIQIDVYKITQAQYLAGTVPSVANTITGSAVPAVAAAVAASSTTLTGWTTEIHQNDYVGFNVDSNSGAYKATIVLTCVKSIGQFSGVGTS